MPEEEFELYLSLLGRFLRLKPAQREEIADELRDHLEERLEELSRQGLAREKAIRRALDEFGDAAELAGHFAQLAKCRRRRVIMRWSLGSAAVAAVAIVMGSALWPELPGANSPPRVVAQQKSAPGVGAERLPIDVPTPAPDDRTAAIEAKLAQHIPKLEFLDTPLRDALDFISETIRVDIIVNKASFTDEGLDLNAPVNIVLKHSDVSAATALQLILESACGRSVTYRIREGFIYIQSSSSASEDLEIRVYNCRDLLQTPAGVGGAPASARYGGSIFGQPPGTGAAQPDHGRLFAAKSPGDALVNVIQNTTKGPWQDIDGAGGMIEEFEGLIVVRQTYEMHREIQELLDMMRMAVREPEKARQP